MKKIVNERLIGERVLFKSSDIEVIDSVFEDGESPLKESRGVSVLNSIFKWKYPLWYSSDVYVKNSTLLITARSGIWYTNNVTLDGCTVDAPKTFRRSRGVSITNCTIPNADETLWHCDEITIKSVSASGDYFGMGSSNIIAEDFSLSGNYAFDGARNIEVNRAKLISKDAFWNCENVIVRDSLIIGEYLGWNSKNIKFINCTIESNQGMCYMDGVVLENCKLINTDLAFEYSSVDARINSHIMSVKNPSSGCIKANSIGEIIHDPECVDVSRTLIEITELKNEEV